MSVEYLLDTNAAIALIERDAALLAVIGDGRAYLNPAALGELRFGAEKSSRPAANHERIDELVGGCPVLDITGKTARFYGRIRDQLRRMGRPIPNNDVWIAATALEYQVALLTRDQHFAELEALDRVSW